jgi:hypothetical protein
LLAVLVAAETTAVVVVLAVIVRLSLAQQAVVVHLPKQYFQL